MKAVVDGLIEPDEEFERSLELCLGCRACETVCPSGVKYGICWKMPGILSTRIKSSLYRFGSVEKRFFRNYSQSKTICAVPWFTGFYQRSGLQAIARKIGFLGLLPDHLATMEKVLPKVPTMKEMKNRPEHLDPIGKKTHRVGSSPAVLWTQCS